MFRKYKYTCQSISADLQTWPRETCSVFAWTVKMGLVSPLSLYICKSSPHHSVCECAKCFAKYVHVRQTSCGALADVLCTRAQCTLHSAHMTLFGYVKQNYFDWVKMSKQRKRRETMQCFKMKTNKIVFRFVNFITFCFISLYFVSQLGLLFQLISFPLLTIKAKGY